MTAPIYHLRPGPDCRYDRPAQEPSDLDACGEVVAKVHEEEDGYPRRCPADPGRWLSWTGLCLAVLAEVGGQLVRRVAWAARGLARPGPEGRRRLPA